jgi:hypothetical protein
MKHLKSVAAAVLALIAADAAFAQTTIRITGSTAFRSGTIASIKNLLQAGYDQAYTGTSASGFSYGTFVGVGNAASGLNGQALVIQCAWTGSVEGIRDVSQGLTQPFIRASAVPNTNGTGVADTTQSITTTTTNATVYEAAIPDITLADNVQAITLYPSPALQEAKVGVIPFVWVKGRVINTHPSFTAYTDNLTNITGQLAQTLLGGSAKLSLLTGNSADAGTKVYVMGRNPLSGTRVVTFTEAGYGSTTSATQFQPNIAGDVTSGTITGVGLMPADVINGFAEGNNGYTSGGTLADELGRTVTDINGSGNSYDSIPFGLVGYMGVGDAARLVKNINTDTSTNVSYILSYNGVSLNPVYSTTTQAITWDFAPIRQGKYSFWSYVYLGYRKSAGPNSTVALTGNAKTFADNLVTDIINTVPATSGIKLSDMSVERSAEGAPITSL